MTKQTTIVVIGSLRVNASKCVATLCVTWIVIFTYYKKQVGQIGEFPGGFLYILISKHHEGPRREKYTDYVKCTEQPFFDCSPGMKIYTITKTSLFKYTENFTTIK